MDKIFKAVGIDLEKKINLEEGIIPFVLTSKTVDRDSEVMLPDGGDIEQFVKNPVFLWAHDMWSPSIGKVLPETIKANSKKMVADVKFDLDDPFAAMVFNKYVNGYLNAGSIRFRPIETSKDPVLPKQKGDTILKWTLLEFSAVPVPANPEALAQVRKGLDMNNEKAKKWDEVLKDFYDNDDLDHTPDGYIDMLNKAEENDPLISLYKKSEIKTETEININKITDVLDSVIRLVLNVRPVPFDSELPCAFHDYDTGESKLIHHKSNEEGELAPDWEMVAQSMIDLFKADEISNFEKLRIYNHLARHYKEFNKVSPEFKMYSKEEIEQFEKPAEETEISFDDIGEQDLNTIVENATTLILEKKQ